MDTRKNERLAENAMTDIQMRSTESYKRFKELYESGVSNDKAFLIGTNEKLKEKDKLKDGQLSLIRRYVYNGLSLSAFMEPDEMDLYREANEALHYFTGFSFLLKHFGLRPGCVHTLLAEAGHGKSSLLRSILIDSAHNCNVLVYLSEESTIQYQTHLNIIVPKRVKNPKKHRKVLDNIKLLSEYEIRFPEIKPVLFLKKLLEGHIEKNKIKLLAIDNFTTSQFCYLTPKEQAQTINLFKSIAIKYNIPVIVLVHPKKGTLQYDKELIQYHIHGGVILKNVSEYIYCMQKLGKLNPIKSFIKIAKSRNHPKANETAYLLEFEEICESSGQIARDRQVTRSYITEIIDQDRKV